MQTKNDELIQLLIPKFAPGRSLLLTVKSFFVYGWSVLLMVSSVWSLLLTVEIRFGLFCLRWKIGLVFFAYGSPRPEREKFFCLKLELVYLQLSFFACSPLRCFLDTLPTASKKAQIVSKESSQTQL